MSASLAARTAIEAGDLVALGALMDVNHALLAELGVSTPELEALVTIARQQGAWGAKLTGGGGGGAMVALCPESPEAVVRAMHEAGYASQIVRVA